MPVAHWIRFVTISSRSFDCTILMKMVRSYGLEEWVVGEDDHFFIEIEKLTVIKTVPQLDRKIITGPISDTIKSFK